MMISIPPKYAVSQVVGFIKGKSAIHLARTYGERKRNFVGQSFWARGFFVSTVGRDEAVIGNTSRTRNRKINARTNSICGVDRRLQAAQATGVASAAPSAASSGPMS
jgi:hypothetical protein